MTEVKMVLKPDPLFERCCKLAGIKPTLRQWRKWLRGEGLATRFVQQAEAQIQEEIAGGA